jgi:hypothetical protein
MTKIRYLVNLNTHKCEYSLQELNSGKPSDLVEFSPQLDASTPLCKKTLGELANILIKYDKDQLEKLFIESGQFEIGDYLFEQLFGHLDASNLERLINKSTSVDIHIITEVNEFLKLPWALLNNKGKFVATAGWSVNFSPPYESWKDIDISPSPRIMIVMPEPGDQDGTEAGDHLKDLQDIFSAHTYNKIIYTVKTWDDFKAKINTVKPHMLYYYGHGESEEGNSRLLFADEDGRSIKISAVEFTNYLRDLGEDAPALIYINCCSGDAGGILGVGKQLRDIIPAVITNCSKIPVKIAQKQAREIWNNILVNKLMPHEAVAVMRKDFGGEPGELSAIRWLLPVIHCGYKAWKFNPNPTPSEIEINWKNKLDRDKPVAQALYHTDEMLNEEYRAVTFLWYGREGHGVERFHDRLINQMTSDRKGIYRVHEVYPNWSPHFENFYQCAKIMMEEAFKVDDFRKIAEEIRITAKKKGGHQLIVYVRHTPIMQEMKLSNTEYLTKYLRWLNDEFASQLGNKTFALIGLPYIVDEPDEFKKGIKNDVLAEVYENMFFHLLDELSELEKKDITKFLSKSRKPFRNDEIKSVADYIISRTNGQLERVMRELDDLQNMNHLEYLEKIKQQPGGNEYL